MEKLLLSLLLLTFGNHAADPPKTSKALPSASASKQKTKAKKRPKLTAETKAAIELSKVKPLPHLEAVKQVEATIGKIRVEEPSAFRLTPRNPWREGAYLNFISANVYAATPQTYIEPYALLRGNTTWSSFFEISFPARSGYAYAIDCQVDTEDFFLNRGGAGQEGISASGGHLVIGLPRLTASGNAKFLVSSARNFRLSGCEVIPGR
jgi:hypothetical protein